MTGDVVVGGRGRERGQTIDSLPRLWLLLRSIPIPKLKTPQKLGRVINLQAHSLKVVSTLPVSAAFSTRQLTVSQKNQKKMKSGTEVGCVLYHSEPLSNRRFGVFLKLLQFFKKCALLNISSFFPPQAYWISIRYFVFFFWTFEFCITF